MSSIGVWEVSARGNNGKEAVYRWTKLESMWGVGGDDEDLKLRILI
jgi:hypothetical protein